MNQSQRSLPTAILADLRFCWKQLALADVANKALAFVLFTPLVGLTFRFFVQHSGRTVLADVDILWFVLSPFGLPCVVLVAGLSIGFAALELGTMMAIGVAASDEHRVRFRQALWFALARGATVIRAATYMVLVTLLAAVPFLATAGLAYLGLLTEFDINYYLAQKPREYWIVVSIAAVLGLGFAAVAVHLITSWLFVLPLVLFEGLSAREAIRRSKDRARGRRCLLAARVVGWALIWSLVSSAVTGLVATVGHVAVESAPGSLSWVALLIGGVLLLWLVTQFVVTLLGNATFALLLVQLYLRYGAAQISARPEATVRSKALETRWLSARAVGIAAALGCVVAGSLGGYALRSVSLPDETQITAHRGASGAAPDNTLAAIERAITDGADWVEIDVQESADGVVVVVHDSDLMKVGGVGLRVWESTAAELREVDVGSWFGPEFRDERIPTLDEVLALCKGRIHVNIELKYYGHNDRLEERVAELVEAHDMQDQIVLMSLEQSVVARMKALRPNWQVGLLTAVTIGDLTRSDADFLAVSTNIATRGFIRAAHRRERAVHVWTINDPLTLSRMMGRGADNIITDEPALARAVLEERAQLSSVERLLLEVAILLGAGPKETLTLDDV